MRRTAFVTLCLLVVAGGCAEAPPPFEMPQKPVPPTELAKLECWVGEWTHTGKIVSPTADEMAKHMPEDAPEWDGTFTGATTMKWGLGGMYLVSDGWHEMGEDEKMHLVEYTTWDCKAKKYRSWSFSDWGERGDGWMWLSPDGKTWHFKFVGVGFDGKKSHGHGTMTMLDDSNAEWTFTERDAHGKMVFEGTSTKK
jgi:hypothetical protein